LRLKKFSRGGLLRREDIHVRTASGNHHSGRFNLRALRRGRENRASQSHVSFRSRLPVPPQRRPTEKKFLCETGGGGRSARREAGGDLKSEKKSDRGSPKRDHRGRELEERDLKKGTKKFVGQRGLEPPQTTSEGSFLPATKQLARHRDLRSWGLSKKGMGQAFERRARGNSSKRGGELLSAF